MKRRYQVRFVWSNGSKSGWRNALQVKTVIRSMVLMSNKLRNTKLVTVEIKNVVVVTDVRPVPTWDTNENIW